ncbi:MAG TPA: glycosyltransferase [Acidimicrobiales bacterium]|nr:glycosyltransferase [Acidimicrobiales bacterium]
MEMQGAVPHVTVVVAVKHSQATIRQTVESLLAQDYQGSFDIRLVGDPDDPTWAGLGELRHHPQLRCLELARPVEGRDVNLKRNMGLSEATGDVLAVTDSDMVLDTSWLSTGVRSLARGYECAAGGMASTHDDYWGLYVDQNVLGAKTPRVPSDYVLTRHNFGHVHRKPPITANLLFTRAVWDTIGPFDTSFQRYEDYEWAWRVVAAGYEILFVRDLCGGHHHRRGLRTLARDYWYSGRGCAEFIATHRDSPLARRRLLQLGGVTAGAAALIASLLLAPAEIVLASVVGLALLLSCVELVGTRRLRALTFPFVTSVLAAAFYAGAIGKAVGARGQAARRSARPSSEANVWDQGRSPITHSHSSRR